MYDYFIHFLKLMLFIQQMFDPEWAFETFAVVGWSEWKVLLHGFDYLSIFIAFVDFLNLILIFFLYLPIFDVALSRRQLIPKCTTIDDIREAVTYSPAQIILWILEYNWLDRDV